MCLRIDKKFKSKKEAQEYTSNPLIAEKDIHVSKVLEPVSKLSANAPYRYNFTYNKGFQYTEDTFSFNYEYRIICGFNTKESFFVATVRQGLHAFLKNKNEKIEWLIHNCNCKVFKMVIPKGSKYFLGTNDEIVSDNLIWY